MAGREGVRRTTWAMEVGERTLLLLSLAAIFIVGFGGLFS